MPPGRRWQLSWEKVSMGNLGKLGRRMSGLSKPARSCDLTSVQGAREVQYPTSSTSNLSILGQCMSRNLNSDGWGHAMILLIPTRPQQDVWNRLCHIVPRFSDTFDSLRNLRTRTQSDTDHAFPPWPALFCLAAFSARLHPLTLRPALCN